MFKKFKKFDKAREADMTEKNTKESTDDDLQARYRNVLVFANEIIERCECKVKKEERHPVYSLIKLFSEKMVINNVCELLMVKDAKHKDNISWLNILLDESAPRDAVTDVMAAIYENRVNIETTINLSKDAVLTTLWDWTRLKEGLSSVATEENPWVEHRSNHHVMLWLPMGVCFVLGGNHSIFSGSIKREGEINISGERHKVYDVSKIYEVLECDGEFYRYKLDNRIICKVPSFEFACIFGIGEIIYLYNKKKPSNMIRY